MAIKTLQLETYGMQQKQFQEGSLQQYSPTSRNKKTSNRQLNFTLKQLEKEEQKTPKLEDGKKSQRSRQK